jgi:Family of unknown function (DUF6174)
MERWRRLAPAAAGAAVLLCLGLMFVPTLYSAGSLALARWRWAQRGGANYSLVVTQRCNCSLISEFRIIVRGGHVVSAQGLGGAAPAGRIDPASFEYLTVAAAFDRAERNLRANWWPTFDRWRRDRVLYDPQAGYIRQYETGDPGAPHFFFVYAASDLETQSP